MTTHNLRAEPEQKYNKDVLRFRREIECKLSGRGASESPTEPDTDAEVEAQHVGMGPHPDIIFCTRAFAKRLGLSLRSFHARFNFDPQNRAFFVASITSSCLAGLTVIGETVTREMRALNQHSMRIRVDSLEYIFQYTDFASSKGFTKMREEYVTTMAGAPSFVVFDMPTPRRTTATIGQWTLSDPLGRGGAGRVFLGSNPKNEVVAIKIMECTPGAASGVDMEIARCRDLTLLARSRDDGGRIVRLKEIIDPRNASTTKSAFEDVALVLEPMTPLILSDWVGNRSRGGSRGMTVEAAIIFREALLGVRFLYDNGWMHGDLKPPNIGVLPGNPPRAVLLDVGQAKALRPGSIVLATPGRGGTVPYLSPEREMTEYDWAADVWSMGIIGYELTYGCHPFKFAMNPWRPGETYEKMRPMFQERYEESIDTMSADYDRCRDTETAGKNPRFIHLGRLFSEDPHAGC